MSALGNSFMCDCVSAFGNPEDVCGGLKQGLSKFEISLGTRILGESDAPLICTDIYYGYCGTCSEEPEEGSGGMSDCLPDNPDSSWPCCYCLGAVEYTTHEVQASPLTIVPAGTTHFSDEEITSACCSSINGYYICEDYTLSDPVYYVPLANITQDKTVIALSGINIKVEYEYSYEDTCSGKTEKTNLESTNLISYPILPFNPSRHTVHVAPIPEGMWRGDISLETLACIYYSGSKKGVTSFTELGGGSCSINYKQYTDGGQYDHMKFFYGVYDTYTQLFYPDCTLSFFQEVDADTGVITSDPNACIEFISISNRGNTKYFLPHNRSGVKIPFVPLYMLPSVDGRICCPDELCGFTADIAKPEYEILSRAASCTAYRASSISCGELKVASS